MDGTGNNSSIGIEAVIHFIVEQLDDVDTEWSVGTASLELLLQHIILTSVLVKFLYFLLRGPSRVGEVCDEVICEASHITK